jgi:rhombotail lipoprotein
MAASMALSLAGCDMLRQGMCAPGCESQEHSSSSLVNFLYPNGQVPPPGNTIPELHVPLRVGLAFLPSRSTSGTTPLDAAQKENLLQKVRSRFLDRKFVADIVIIPDYYLANAQGFAGLEGVQRLYNIDLMALVSHDQVTHGDDNKLSLGYLTIVGAFVLRGSSHETATLVDLAVVDPATHSLVLRAGGTDMRSGNSTMVDASRDMRHDSASGFDAATAHMIDNFDAALTAFEADVHAGKANVRVVSRNGGHDGGHGGGGAMDSAWLLAALALGACTAVRGRARRPSSRDFAPNAPGTAAASAHLPLYDGAKVLH